MTMEQSPPERRRTRDTANVSHLSDNLLGQLDAYLDGSMAATDRSAFERRMASDEALRVECELSRRIEGSLRGSFAPPRAVWSPSAPAEAEAVRKESVKEKKIRSKVLNKKR